MRWVEGPAEKGVHRVSWDLRRPAPDPIDLSEPDFVPPWVSAPKGPLVAPGRYSVELLLVANGNIRTLSDSQSFMVKPVPTAPSGTDFEAVAAFQNDAAALMRDVAAAQREISRLEEKLTRMRASLLEAPLAAPELHARFQNFDVSLSALKTRLSGDQIRQSRSEATSPSIRARIGRVVRGHWDTRQAPTATQQRSFELAETEFTELRQALSVLIAEDFAEIEAALERAGAPSWK